MKIQIRGDLAVILGCVMLFSPLCFGQESSQERDVNLPEVGYRAEVRSAVSAPGAQLAATNSSSSVALKFSSDPRTRIAPRSDKPGLASWSSWSLTAEAPLKKNEKRYDFFNQDGWGNSTSLGVNYVTFVTPQSPKDEAALARYCHLGQDARFEEEKKMALIADPTGANLDQLRKKIAADGCLVDNIRKRLPNLLEDFRAASGYPRKGGLLLGVSAALAFQNVKFYSPDTFAEAEEDKRPWSVAITGGWNPERMNKLFLLVRVQHKRSYEEDDESTRCPIEGITPTVVCVTGSFAPPKLAKNHLISVESRYLFTKVAIAAIISRNISKEVTTVEIPAYLIGNEKVPFNGGIRLGWNSKDKDLKAGVFVGVPFVFF